MTDQLQNAIAITRGKIADLEAELRREREFLSRLLPGEIPRRRGRAAGANWLAVFSAIAQRPLKHEHIIDFIEESALGMSRGATRVWLNEKAKRGYLKRDKAGSYSVTPSGLEWLKASSS